MTIVSYIELAKSHICWISNVEIDRSAVAYLQTISRVYVINKCQSKIKKCAFLSVNITSMRLYQLEIEHMYFRHVITNNYYCILCMRLIRWGFFF
jgi:hypothetical protein